MSEIEKIVKEIKKNIETSVKEGLNEFEFMDNFNKIIEKYIEGKL